MKSCELKPSAHSLQISREKLQNYQQSLYSGCYKLKSCHHALFILPEPWLLGNIITFLEKVSNQLILYPDSALHCFSQTMIPSLCNYFCSLNTGHLLIPPSLHSCNCCILLLDIPPVRGLVGDRRSHIGLIEKNLMWGQFADTGRVMATHKGQCCEITKQEAYWPKDARGQGGLPDIREKQSWGKKLPGRICGHR